MNEKMDKLLTQICENQADMFNALEVAFDRVAEHEQVLGKTKKKLRRQARATRLTTVISAVAITYMVVSARVVLHQGQRISSLNNELIDIRKSRFGSVRSQEGK